MKLLHVRFLVIVLAFSLFQLSCSKKFNQLQKKGTVDEKYKAAIDYYQKADYYKAGVLLEEITPLLKGDSTSERAQFYNAYCNYYQSNFQMSSYLFKTFYSTYNNSEFAEEAYYMYAYSMFKDAPPHNLDQTNTLTAIDALQTFINTYPDSKYAKKCSQDLNDLRFRLELKAYEKAKLYFKTREPSFLGRSNYKATVVSVENFRKDFPDSKFNEELSYLQILAQQELSDVSYFIKQRERYNEAINLHEKFIDRYPNSKYLKELDKIYEKSLKGLEKVAKTEKEIEEAKKLAEKEKS
ncbi:outer membrane protein assembly factor BamD [Lacihabitans sp. CS3-21]|jgi:outer membrane protein assembly factor BamD|uniref:outer membrane protein assembly factor BamD n=1 Tax=Lacihabitans sp. CS3-21 TaxID=2487332 RepID=UPI000BD8DB47|nr:outer membrane protein assembly factor BamD [Lacihabitans sp. CS3-21]MCP9747373.1 outer membrane protein assembly factor BamD [Lacihabitans sp. CS3-21]OYU65101.1 MAG: outer membrane protein assembly factor BamD [Cytophagaceae bacterium BCCC1]